MASVLAFLLATIAAQLPPAGSSMALAFDLPVTELVLDNGMTVLVVDRSERPFGGTVAAGWMVRAGSRHDPPGASGLAHLVEHSLYGGSGRLASGGLPLLYARAGATDVGGRTFEDFTWFTAELPAEQLELWFWLESDRLLAPQFVTVDREIGVIRQERRQMVDERPTGRAEERLRAAHWRDHPYGAATVGRPAELERLGTAEVEAFFRRHYGPSNLVAAVVGDVDVERVTALARRYFGRLEPRANAAAPDDDARKSAPTSETEHRSSEERSIEAMCACAPQARVLYRTVAAGDRDVPALAVAAAIFNGRSGRLYRELVATGMATSAWVEHRPLVESGEFTFVAEASRSTSPQRLVAAWDEAVDELVEGDLSRAEVGSAAWRVGVDAVREIDGSPALMRRLLVSAGLGRWERAVVRPRQYGTVTAAAVQRVVATHLQTSRRTVGIFRRQGDDG